MPACATVLGLTPSSRLNRASKACDHCFAALIARPRHVSRTNGVLCFVRGACVTNLSHAASLHSRERITPLNRGIKLLATTGNGLRAIHNNPSFTLFNHQVSRLLCPHLAYQPNALGSAGYRKPVYRGDRVLDYHGLEVSIPCTETFVEHPAVRHVRRGNSNTRSNQTVRGH